MGKYFGLGDDWGDLTAGYTSGGTKALAGLKILGKVVANVGTFAATEVVPTIAKQMGNQIEKGLEQNRSNMTPEQVEKAEKSIKWGAAMGERHSKIKEIDGKISSLQSELEECERKGDEWRVDRIREEIEQLKSDRPSLYGSHDE